MKSDGVTELALCPLVLQTSEGHTGMGHTARPAREVLLPQLAGVLSVDNIYIPVPLGMSSFAKAHLTQGFTPSLGSPHPALAGAKGACQ